MLRTLTLFAPVLLGFTPVPSPYSVPLAIDEVEDIVLEVDPETHMPMGPLVEAEGLLLDPRDLPESVIEYLSPAEGLEGLEASLTALYCRSLGFASEGKKLPRRYRDFAKHQSSMWADLVAGEVGRIDWENPELLVGSAMWHDTGRRVSPNELRVVGPAQIAFAPIESDVMDELLPLQSDVAQFGVDMPKEAAGRLSEAVTAYEDDFSDPWFGHSRFHLLMLKMGLHKEEHLANPFEMTGTEFLKRIQRAVREALVDPLFPELPEDVAGEDIYFLEGLVFAQGIAKGEDWPEVPTLEAHNTMVHQPILLLQIEGGKPGKSVKSPKRVRIAMVVDGETRTLHEGKWPLR